MGDEAVNGVNTGVYGGFVGVWWTVVAGGDGKVEESLTNGVEKAWKKRWKMTKKEALAEAEASFFVGCGKGWKVGYFVVILGLGLQKGLQKGVTLDGERGYKKWK